MPEKLTIAGIAAGLTAAIISFKKIIAKIKQGVGWLQAEWTKVAPIVWPIVIEVEQMSLAGPMDGPAKKKLALDILAVLEKNGKVKLNLIQRWAVGRAIDYLAEKLPSFDISKEIKQAIEEIKQAK